MKKLGTSKVSARFQTVIPAEVRPWLNNKLEVGDSLDWFIIDEKTYEIVVKKA